MNAYQQYSSAFVSICKDHLAMLKEGTNLKHLLMSLLVLGAAMFLTDASVLAQPQELIPIIGIAAETVVATFQIGAHFNPPKDGIPSEAIELLVPLNLVILGAVLCFVPGSLQIYLLSCGALLLWTLLVIFRGRSIRGPNVVAKEDIAGSIHTMA